MTERAAGSLDKHRLAGHRARVVLAVDHSGSMRPLYRSGRVQALAERVLALATRLDDDGAIDVVLFGTEAWRAGALTLADYRGGIDRMTAGHRLGRTNYAGAMHLVRDIAGAGDPFADPSGAYAVPTLCLFLTDGAPDSRTAATAQLVAASAEGVFFAFLGVTASPEDAKPARFDYLRRLDTSVPGRLVDNASFVEADDVDALDDDTLYDAILHEYPTWLPPARAHGLVR
nr:VWA domain-containing protein [Motilibacter aurantiacus]